MDLIKLLNISDIMDLLSGNYMEILSKYFTIIAIPIFIAAMINCFFGHRIFKILVGLAGLFIGALLGAGIYIGITVMLRKSMPGIAMIAFTSVMGAIVLGFLSFKLYKAGAFCMGFITGMTLGIVIMKLIGKDEYVIAGVIGGLLMGLLAIDLYKHVVIILTSVNGGLVGAACLAVILNNDDPVFILKLGAGFCAAGIIFQYVTLLLHKRKKADNDEQEDEKVNAAEDEKSEKHDAEKKKETKKQSSKKEIKKTNTKKKIKKSAKNKKSSDKSDFFLVEIISYAAQKVKDFIMNRVSSDGLDREDEYESMDYEEEDYGEEEYEEKDYEEENAQEEDIVKSEENKKKISMEYENSRHSIENKNVIIMENEISSNNWQGNENMVRYNEAEDISIPEFNFDEISKGLEKELNHRIKEDEEEELTKMIIKETIKNID
ncbi:uncharacterized protein DUF4203 [Lachnotalea glycerini]|uniref:Uncharacterized protein DUF4203 n=1 Tax=Lachnotalea glycerini TaxID=1763509 RepID=A0A318F0R5_9FIRM|nr:DUF4203 domain-containing protein [Lachnotalea glycerini]PXV95478.1 uncharacterized protein DUF4203 [Lachnotalea glycerini]